MRSKHMLLWAFYCLFLTSLSAQTINTNDMCWDELAPMRGTDTLTQQKIDRYQQCMRQVGYTKAYIDKFFGNYPISVVPRSGEEALNVCINQVGVCINVVSSRPVSALDSSNVIANLSQTSVFLDRPAIFTFPAVFTTDPLVSTSQSIKLFVDFGDGRGELTTPIMPNQIVAISYNNVTVTKKMMTFRLQFTPVIAPHRVWNVVKKREINLQRRSDNAYTYKAPDETWMITAAEDYIPNTSCMVGTGGLMKDRKPGKGVGFAHIQYANADRKLRKPVIIVEGLDFPMTKLCDTKYSTTTPIKVGNFGWDTFISGIQADIPDESTFYKFPNMAENLKIAGFDVILLDFEDGADYIQKNALIVMALLDKVNQVKQSNGSCEQNIILGASMGGQVVRFALAKMERLQAQSGKAGHDCRIYVSFDSPQKGAIIPLALQAFVFFTANFGEGGGNASAQRLSINLNRPAPQQLLIHHLNTTIGSRRENTCNLRDAYLNELQNEGLPINIGDNANLKGYPRLCKNIAIACGSNNGLSLNESIVPGLVVPMTDNSRLLCGKIMGQVTLNGIPLPTGLSSVLGTVGTLFQLELFNAGGGTVVFERDNGRSGSQIETNVIAFVKFPNRRLKIRIVGFSTPLPDVRYDILLLKRTSNNSINLLVHSDKSESQGNSTPLFPQTVLSMNGTYSTPFAGTERCPGGVRNDLIEVKANLKPQLDAGRTAITRSTFNCASPNSITFNSNQDPASVCFIPTVSALDINTSDFFYNIKQFINTNVPSPNLHPFSTIFVESKNLRHAEVTDPMNTWLLTQAKGGTTASAPLASTLPAPQGSTYNYGDPSNQTLPSVTINSGGSLLINNVGATAYGSGAAAQSAGFIVNTASCGATITVNPQGKVRVGTMSANKRGTLNLGKGANMTILSGEGSGMVVHTMSELNIRDGGTLTVGNGGFLLNEWGANTTIGAGGTLRVLSGGTLRIAQYAKLAIESGGRLVIEPGATIQLWDGSSTAGSATIHVKGGGELILNGNFSFSGNGYFQFDRFHLLRVNGAFTLSGQNRDTRLIQLNAGAFMDITAPLNQLISIQNGLIQYNNVDYGMWFKNSPRLLLKNLRIEGTMADGQRAISVDKPNFLSIDNCNFNTNRYGLSISENPNSLSTTITNCKFGKNMNGSLSLDNMILPVSITNCTFEANKSIALSAFGAKSLAITNCNFGLGAPEPPAGTNNRAISIGGITNITLLKSTISGFGTGIKVDAISNNESKFFVNSSTISNCGIGICFRGGGDKSILRLECATFKNNSYVALEGTNVELQIDAENNRTCATYPRRPNNFILSSVAGARLMDLKYTSPVVPKTNPIPAAYNFWGRADGTSITNPTAPLATATLNGQPISFSFGGQYATQQACPPDPTVACKSTDILQGRSEVKDVNYAIFPNPSSSEVTLQMPDTENSRVFVRNMFGSIVFDKVNISTLDVSGLPAGMYILSVTDKSGTIFKYHTKLIVTNE